MYTPVRKKDDAESIRDYLQKEGHAATVYHGSLPVPSESSHSLEQREGRGVEQLDKRP